MEKHVRGVLVFSKTGYVIGCVILYIFALWIIFSALYSLVIDMYNNTFSVYNLLDEVGLIVFSIAVIDVAKYLMVEEVLKHAKARPPHEERQILTRFVIIIATALALEGLVLTIEVSRTHLEKLIYPVLLLLTSIVFILGIGIYQKFNSSAEKH